MKRNLMFLLFAIHSYIAYNQFVSNCPITSELREAYDWDVSQLALTRILETNSVYRDSIEIPETVKDTIWEGLAAIYNTALPERDSVFDIYCIHDFKCWDSPYQIVCVEVDTTYEWTESWRNGDIHTGLVELDDFLAAYDFELDGGGPMHLHTTEYINIEAFTDSLEKFEGIVQAFDCGTSCCHNKIAYEMFKEIRTYTFDLGFVSGLFFCPNHYTWSFAVDMNCNVELAESTHLIQNPFQLLPDELTKNCHITSEIQKPATRNTKFIISPNPASNNLCIETESPEYFRVSVFSIQGWRLYSSDFSQLIDISLNEYESGVYIVIIHNTNNEASYRHTIIKK